MNGEQLAKVLVEQAVQHMKIAEDGHGSWRGDVDLLGLDGCVVWDKDEEGCKEYLRSAINTYIDCVFEFPEGVQARAMIAYAEKSSTKSNKRARHTLPPPNSPRRLLQALNRRVANRHTRHSPPCVS